MVLLTNVSECDDSERPPEMGSGGTRPLNLSDRGSHTVGMIAVVTS